MVEGQGLGLGHRQGSSGSAEIIIGIGSAPAEEREAANRMYACAETPPPAAQRQNEVRTAEAGETIHVHRGERARARPGSTVFAEAGSHTYGEAGSTVNVEKGAHVLAQGGTRVNEAPGADVVWEYKAPNGNRYQSRDDMAGGSVDKFIFASPDGKRQETFVDVAARDPGDVGYHGPRGQVVSMKTNDGSTWEKYSAIGYPGAAQDGLWCRVDKNGNTSDVALGVVQINSSGITIKGKDSDQVLKVLQQSK